MATIKVGLDNETYMALMDDADRHLRPADWHVTALLRLALGLEFPFPVAAEGEGLCPQGEPVGAWSHGPGAAGTCVKRKRPQA